MQAIAPTAILVALIIEGAFMSFSKTKVKLMKKLCNIPDTNTVNMKKIVLTSQLFANA